MSQNGDFVVFPEGRNTFFDVETEPVLLFDTIFYVSHTLTDIFLVNK